MNCTGIFGRLFGHDYAAAYDERGGEALSLDVVQALNNPMGALFAGDVPEAMRAAAAGGTSTYRGHVCRRCGRTVNTKEEQGCSTAT